MTTMVIHYAKINKHIGDKGKSINRKHAIEQRFSYDCVQN